MSMGRLAVDCRTCKHFAFVGGAGGVVTRCLHWGFVPDACSCAMWQENGSLLADEKPRKRAKTLYGKEA